MKDFIFVIPVLRDELVGNSSNGEYCVQELLAEEEVVVKIQDCRLSLDQNGPEFIFEHFNVLFSSLFCFGELEHEARRQLFTIALNAVEKLNGELSLTLDDELLEDDRKRCLNALKMLCYILCKLIESFETETFRVSSLNLAPKVKVRHAKKKKMSSVLNDEGWDWHQNLHLALKLMREIVTLPIYRLWVPPVLEEEFVNLLCNTCYKVLENPGIKTQSDLKKAIFHLLGKMISKYNHTITCSLKFVQLLQYHEHLVTPLVEGFQVFVTEYNATGFLNEVIGEIGRIQSRDVACDTSSSRAFAAFLAEIARVNPTVFKTNMHFLTSYLEGESYTMVNCVLGIMGEIISSVSHWGEEMDPRTRFMCDKFMDRLECHVHDIHAFVRNRALQIWMRLCEEDAIPVKRKHTVLKLVRGRMMDKAVLVRKTAVQLTTNLLSKNPFAPTFNLEELKANLAAERKKLVEMQPDFEEQEANESSDDEEEAEGTLAPIDENRELTKQKLLVDYLKNSIAFVIEIGEAIDTAHKLLKSALSSDVLEAVQFCVTAQKFGFDKSAAGIRKMLPLVFSKEQTVKNVVVAAFKDLYLTSQSSQMVANNLMMLTIGATVGEMLSLEELVCECVKNGEIGNGVIKLLWTNFCNPVLRCGTRESRASIKLIGMVAKAQPEMILRNIPEILNYGLGQRADGDFQFARDVCKAILKMSLDTTAVKERQGARMFTANSDLVKWLVRVLLKGLTCSTDDAWVPFAEQVIKVFYGLVEYPDTLVGKMIKQMLQIIKGRGENGASCEVFVLARFVDFVGMVALGQFIHLDIHVFGALKRRRALKEALKKRRLPLASDSRRLSASRSRSKSYARTSYDDTDEGSDGVVSMGSEDTDLDFIRNICENSIVTGDGLLPRILPLIVSICTEPGKFPDTCLYTLASTAIARSMLVSTNFCEMYMRLLFTMLEKSTLEAVRVNLVFAVGDLYRRFPNLVEPWTPQLYARLKDDSIKVRKCAVVVLSQLILNDMIKLKGQISEMALLYLDEDRTLAAQIDNLFTKLSQKENAIYNILPDMISNLTDPNRNIEQDNFRKIIKFLLGFVQKEKQLECLVEKCCHRLAESKSERQWSDLVFCISLLCTNGKCLGKLCDNFSCYADKLGNAQVHQQLMAILSALKKNGKLDIKNAIEELEDKIQDRNKRAVEDEAALANVNKYKGKSRQTGNSALKSGKIMRRENESSDDSDFSVSSKLASSFSKTTSTNRDTRSKSRSALKPSNKSVSKGAATRKIKLMKILDDSDSDTNETVLDDADTENIPCPGTAQ